MTIFVSNGAESRVSIEIQASGRELKMVILRVCYSCDIGQETSPKAIVGLKASKPKHSAGLESKVVK